MAPPSFCTGISFVPSHFTCGDRRWCVRALRSDARFGKLTTCLFQPASRHVLGETFEQWGTTVIGPFYNGLTAPRFAMAFRGSRRSARAISVLMRL
jgi:hypothetical protein